jgi:hypothetical protein
MNYKGGSQPNRRNALGQPFMKSHSLGSSTFFQDHRAAAQIFAAPTRR